MPDASVDVVISNWVINLSALKADVFAEIFRVLKSGGRLAVSDVVVDPEKGNRYDEAEIIQAPSPGTHGKDNRKLFGRPPSASGQIRLHQGPGVPAG